MMQKNNIGEIYQRPWGTYQTVAFKDNYQIKIITVNPGGRLSLQKHSKRAEHWVVVKGNPTFTINDTAKTYQVNDRVFIPIATKHRMENFTDTDAVIIEVQVGDYLGEDDIVRLEDVYGRS
ncbi:MAG: phosphomannose isomerase type II C-terminal cupin domain [Gammaproteobacteria bacterium]|nr:phosphomannose isomerase type II C-terminal cupin domain [Gammaproteobacteria bacterium]